jgi:hypothetical protein
MVIDAGVYGKLAICPACGYPTLGMGICAACLPSAATEVDPVNRVSYGAPDFNPAA